MAKKMRLFLCTVEKQGSKKPPGRCFLHGGLGFK